MLRARRWRCNRRGARERGATSVEYAIITALMVGSSSFIIGAVTDTASDAVETRGDRIGNPGNYVPAVDPGGDDGGVVGEDVGGPAETVTAIHLNDINNRRNTGFNPKWQASVDIELARSSGSDPVPGVQVLGHWIIITKSGSSKIEQVDCITDANSVCTMTAGGLRLTGNKDQHAWFVFDSLTVDPAIYSWDTANDSTVYGAPPSVLVCDPNSTYVPGATSQDDTCT